MTPPSPKPGASEDDASGSKDQSSSEPSPIVVGIGASAGGLAAFRELMEVLPADENLAYVLIQHLDPDHKSLLSELLGRNTSMSVCEAQDNVVIEKGHVYVIPAGVFLVVREGRLRHVERRHAPTGGRMAVDTFFKSMAEELGERAVAIVLSGAGSDGAAGVRAVKAAGGFTIAQDRSEAEHDSMPRSASEQGGADRVLTIKEIPEAISLYAQHPYVCEDPAQPGDTPPEGDSDGDSSENRLSDETLVGQIVELVKQQSGFAVEKYKQSTVARRVRRRMGLLAIHDPDDYIQQLKTSDQEINRLCRDLLISVTDFFRDADSFAFLAESVIPDLVRRAHERDEDDRLRLWVAGCATGEEAYSLGMLALEEIERQRADVNLQIFATDIDTSALRFARQAVYPPASATQIAPARRERWLRQSDSGSWQILRELRDCVSFAGHNVLEDPPLSKIDLVSCRNMLIYLRREAQRESMSLFHFALRPESVLFLGSSETTGGEGSGYETISKRHRVYRKLGSSRHIELLVSHGSQSAQNYRHKQKRQQADASRRQRVEPTLADLARKSVLETVAPAAVVLDPENRVIYITGDVKPYLDFPTGEMVPDLMKMLRTPLRTRVRAAIFKARRERHTVSSTVVQEHDNGDRVETLITVALRPDASAEDDALVVVAFRPADARLRAGASAASADEDLVTRLESELAATKEDLRSTIEELETANEELKSSNEEATTMNEELQSSNEELEASSEELRSLNEELSTVNAQLKDKIDELEESNNDLTNLMTSTRLAAVFLDTEFCVRRFTTEAQKLLNVIESDVGRPIHHLKGECIDHELLEDARVVLEGLAPSERELPTEDGRWFLRRVMPYRTENNHIAGVVVVYHNVTRLKQATARAESREQQHAAIARLGLRALSDVGLDDLMQEVCMELTRVLDADFAKVLEYRAEQDDMLVRAGEGWPEGVVGQASVPADVGSQAGFTLRSVEPVIVEDLAAERRFTGPDLLTDHGVASGMSCVIPGGTTAFGVLGVHAKHTRAFTGDDANFLQSAANLLAVASQLRANEQKLRKSEAEARRGEAEIESLYRLAPVGLSVVNRDRRYRRINQMLADINGHSIDYHLGKTGREILPLDIAEPVDRLLDRVFNGTAVRDIEVEGELPGSDGARQWLVTFLPIYGLQGEVEAAHALVIDVTKLKAAENRERMLRHELDHRLKNTMMTVVSVADLTAHEAKSVKQFRESFVKRMLAISSVHTQLSGKSWTHATLNDVAQAVLEPYRRKVGHRIELSGPEIVLATKTGLMLGMMLHELATNAVKYGSLSVEGGSLLVNWERDDEQVVLTWTERGGPHVVPPERQSYGLTLVQQAGPYEIGGDAELTLRRRVSRRSSDLRPTARAMRISPTPPGRVGPRRF